MLDKAVHAFQSHDLGAVYTYWRRHGLAATVRQVGSVLLEPQKPQRSRGPSSPAQLINRQFLSLSPLPIQQISGPQRRLNLITDTINVPHLYGGVGTAMIFAALFAERIGCSLRIITRSAKAHEKNFKHIMHVAGLSSPVRVEFAYVPYGAERPRLDCSDDEIFITSSWWTTYGTRQAILPERIIYLLQEDERMFYPHGDEQLRCSEILQSKDLTFLVNTKLLFDYFSDAGFPSVAKNGIFFEPSFPPDMFYPQTVAGHGPPYRFLYYARPHNQRNLFYRGLEAIDRAVSAGILLPNEWEFYFVGKDIPRLKLAGSLEPKVYENLSWQSYATLARKMDLGMCLMYTPHPSYPPLDLAASGAVVVTNRFLRKSSLDQYSENIICKEAAVEDLVSGIAEGVELALSGDRRQQNFQRNHILRDWRKSFTEPLEVLAKKYAR